jgi:hypothetical protein
MHHGGREGTERTRCRYAVSERSKLRAERFLPGYHVTLTGVPIGAQL